MRGPGTRPTKWRFFVDFVRDSGFGRSGFGRDWRPDRRFYEVDEGDGRYARVAEHTALGIAVVARRAVLAAVLSNRADGRKQGTFGGREAPSGVLPGHGQAQRCCDMQQKEKGRDGGKNRARRHGRSTNRPSPVAHRISPHRLDSFSPSQSDGEARKSCVANGRT